MVVNILFVGFNHDKDWYLDKTKKLVKSLNISDFRLLFIDNKHSSKNIIHNENHIIELKKENNYFEFSAYLSLLTYIKRELKSKSKKKENLFLLINDTIFTHHATYPWLISLKKLIKIIDNPDLYGDLRYYEKTYQTVYASWVYLFNYKVLDEIIDSIKESIENSQKFLESFNAIDLSNYGRGLSNQMRQKIINWLFSSNIFYGWSYAMPFKTMPLDTRFRKGLCIFLEHEVSLQLVEKGIEPKDIKSITLIARIANFLDRVYNFYLKFRISTNK